MSIFDKPIRVVPWATILLAAPIWLGAVLLAAPIVLLRVAWIFATDFLREALEL